MDFLRKHIEEIVKISDEEFEIIKTYFEKIRLRKKQFLIQENQNVEHIYLTKEGFLKSSFYDKNDNEFIIQFACENWWITDYSAFYSQQKSTISIECVENSELYALSFENMNELAEKFPKMNQFFRMKLSLGYVALQERLMSLMTKSAQERYEELLTNYPKIEQKVSKLFIAKYLGVSRETLSRLKFKK